MIPSKGQWWWEDQTREKKTWQYKVMDLSWSEDAPKEMNVLGEDGWESFSVTFDPMSLTFRIFFKRRKY